MKKLLEWIDQKKMQHGQIVVLLATLALFTVLAVVLALVYAFFIGIIHINPNLVYLLTLFLLIAIIAKNRL